MNIDFLYTIRDDLDWLLQQYEKERGSDDQAEVNCYRDIGELTDNLDWWLREQYANLRDNRLGSTVQRAELDGPFNISLFRRQAE